MGEKHVAMVGVSRVSPSIPFIWSFGRWTTQRVDPNILNRDICTHFRRALHANVTADVGHDFRRELVLVVERLADVSLAKAGLKR